MKTAVIVRNQHQCLAPLDLHLETYCAWRRTIKSHTRYPRCTAVRVAESPTSLNNRSHVARPNTPQ